jgi:hypothetical protein
MLRQRNSLVESSHFVIQQRSDEAGEKRIQEKLDKLRMGEHLRYAL